MLKKYLGIMLALFLIISSTVPFPVMAAGEQANSPGVSGQKPLAFTGITLMDGGQNVANATDIPLTPKFKLLFDKNVVNSLFWENNSKCFSMISESNENTPIDVTKVDDTIDFSLRQVIFVQPKNSLQPGTTYRLIVSPELKAKNGVANLGGTTNGQGVTITFKTTGTAVQTLPASTETSSTPQSPSNQNPSTTTNTSNTSNTSGNSSAQQITADNAAAATGGDNPADTAATEQSNVNNNAEGTGAEQNQEAAQAAGETADDSTKASAGFSSLNWVAIAGAILALGWVAVELYSRKKKNNRKE